MPGDVGGYRVAAEVVAATPLLLLRFQALLSRIFRRPSPNSVDGHKLLD